MFPAREFDIEKRMNGLEAKFPEMNLKPVFAVLQAGGILRNKVVCQKVGLPADRVQHVCHQGEMKHFLDNDHAYHMHCFGVGSGLDRIERR